MTIFFPDLSHYNGGTSLKGAPAVIAKATQGTSYVDHTYDVFRVQAAALGIPFCAYHWLDTTAASAQAKHCFSVVGPKTPLMIDDEQQRISVSHTLEFVAAYRALGGRVILEYAPAWVWRNSGRPNLIPLARAGLGIVSSSYTGYTDNGPGWAPYGGVTPIIWQYADNQLFNGRRVDFNAYRGSQSQLAALFGGPTSGDDVTPADFLAILADPKVAAKMAQLAWSYQDAGQPSAHDLLLSPSGALRKAIGAGSIDAAAVKAALMDPAVLKAIAAAVNDDAATRLKT